MRHVIVLAIFVTVAAVGPDLWVHMLSLVLVGKLRLDLLEQYILIEILGAMHLLCLSAAV